MPKNIHPGTNFLTITQDKVFQSNVKFCDFVNNPKLQDMAKGMGQGTLIEDKIEGMITEYDEHPDFFAHKRIITIAVMNNNYYMVDGQHRVEMAKRLYTNNNKCRDNHFVCIWHNVNNEEEMRNIFDSINIDSIKNHMYVSQDVFQKSRIDIFICYFINKNNGWHKDFAKTSRVNPKKFTLESIRDILIKDDFFNREQHAQKKIYCDFNSNESFVDYICRSNMEFYEKLIFRYEDSETINHLFYVDEINNIVNRKVFMLCNNNFFEWLMNKESVIPTHKIRNACKKTIPQPIKKQVWSKWCKNEESVPCPFYFACGNLMEKNVKNGWHCGHIVSEANDGDVSVENLRPICQGCNSSMGPNNWDVYESRIKSYQK